jgi:hypothetical protein
MEGFDLETCGNDDGQRLPAALKLSQHSTDKIRVVSRGAQYCLLIR